MMGDCIDRNLDGLCLVNTQFTGSDVLCSAVVDCPFAGALPVNTAPGFKDYGVINFGNAHRGERWDSLPISYLDWLAYKSSMGMEIRRKATEVLRMVRAL